MRSAVPRSVQRSVQHAVEQLPEVNRTRALISGALAGAAGTTALNVVTYLDMSARGRPGSSMPAKVSEKVADKAHVDLGPDDQRGNRSEGIGALLGIATGVGAGMLYGLVTTGRRPGLAAGTAVLSAIAMAGSDLPLVASGLTDVREWGVSGWLSDAIPHIAYGFTTALVLDRFAGA